MWALLFTLAHAADVDNLDEVMRAHAAAGRFVGAIRVQQGDTVVLDATYGDVPSQPVCRIGSVSKSFTAAAIYALADEGLLSVDDPIGRHVPELAAHLGDGPTLRQLLIHQGGLSEPQVNPWAPPPTWAQQAAVMVPMLSQEHAPGTHERYSNFGFTLLAVAAANAAGMPFEQVLNTRLLDRLGMADTGIDDTPNRAAHLIEGRLHTPVGLVRSQRALPRLLPNDYRWPHGGDGALTSSTDLVTWASALRDGHILSDAARADMVRVAEGHQTGAGWVVEGDWRWHNGALEPLGIYAYVRWSATDDQVVAFCGTPGIATVAPEWRHIVEAALAGEQSEPISMTAGPFGWLAALSTLWAHTLLALVGVVLAAAARGTGATRLGLGGIGAAMALLGLGLTHAALGTVAAVGVGGWTVINVRRRATRWGTWQWGLVVVAAMAALASAVVVALLAGLSTLIDNMWSIAA